MKCQRCTSCTHALGQVDAHNRRVIFSRSGGVAVRKARLRCPGRRVSEARLAGATPFYVVQALPACRRVHACLIMPVFGS